MAWAAQRGERRAHGSVLDRRGGVIGRCRIAVVQLWNEFYALCSSNDMFLSSGAARRLEILGRQLCMLYCKLSADAISAGKKFWKMTPKVHLFLHLCEWQGPLYGNPAYYWCYGDEDLVGKLIEVAETCHPRALGETALFKWLIVAFD